MAEAVLKHQITQRTALLERMDIRVDSAGTGAYHAGDDADSRTIETCRRVSLPLSLKYLRAHADRIAQNPNLMYRT
jgi:low molecular weight phosphotyrosine protein phosphatase